MDREWYVDTMNRTTLGRYLTEIEMGALDNYLSAEPGIKTILDIGGGSGRFALPLRQRGYQVIVVEVDAEPLRNLRAHSREAAAVLTGIAPPVWPIGPASVDCVLAIEIPVIYSDWFWSESRRVVKPNGVVITNFVNKDSYKGMLYQLRPLLRPFLSNGGKRWADRQMYDHSARDVERTLTAHGFRLDHALGFNWLPVGRSSDLSLIPLMGSIERGLGLRNLPYASPWVMVKARAA
jgi:SAM-dependent methyltransferase